MLRRWKTSVVPSSGEWRGEVGQVRVGYSYHDASGSGDCGGRLRLRVTERDVPRQQFIVAVVRGQTNAINHGLEAGVLVDIVQPRGADGSVDQRRGVPAPVGAGEEVILASQRYGTKRPLGDVVADSPLDQPFSSA